jgi:hypothetical protein
MMMNLTRTLASKGMMNNNVLRASMKRTLSMCSSSNRPAAFISNSRPMQNAVIKRQTTAIAQYIHDSNDQIEDSVSKWVKNVIVGLNFCPFAEKSRSTNKLFTHIVRGDDVEEILSNVLYESILRSDDTGTTLIVCPDLFPDDFLGFYEVVAQAEMMLQDNELEGVIQIAPFHPQFQFQGSEKDGVDNLTNRSPYPIFHILREEEVDSAVRKLDGDSSRVWQRNIDLLERMEEEYGREKTNEIMSGKENPAVAEWVKSQKFTNL